MTKDIEILNSISNVTKLAFGQEYFEAVGEMIQQVTKADYTFIIKIDQKHNTAHPIVSLKNGVKIENFDYN